MIAEAKQQYRGARCIHRHQPIPLSPSAELKQIAFKEHGPSDLGDFSVFSITLRCRVCHGEGVYSHSDVIDVDGIPRKRSSHAHKNPKPDKLSCSGYPLKRRVEFCTVKQALPSFLDSRLCC
jgi:hypothetical protein